jgi:hypothetical protein
LDSPGALSPKPDKSSSATKSEYRQKSNWSNKHKKTAGARQIAACFFFNVILSIYYFSGKKNPFFVRHKIFNV